MNPRHTSPAPRPADEPATGSEPAAPNRRGRPRDADREVRRRRVVEAAFEELIESGYDGTTMLGIARRAGASKETLYTWFGNRDGLFAALIREQADTTSERVRAALDADAEPVDVLTEFATGLLTLLTAQPSVMLNRAAMSSPELAELLLAGGRYNVGPLVERYLERLDADGVLAVADPSDAFRVLYGLIIQDSQIRVLLGEQVPTRSQIVTQATGAVERFVQLYRR